MKISKAIAIITFLHFLFFVFCSCSNEQQAAVDELNSISYAYHFRQVDSAEHYAQQAFILANEEGYVDGKAEALNHLAFVDIVKMHYADARMRLDSVLQFTDNQLERFVAYVQQMRLCQRQSLNREFYDCREQAQRALERINEERDYLSDRQLKRLLYAETEFSIVNSTYYYYVGLGRQSIEAMQSIRSDVETDTVQFLNYLYNVGAGGIITQGTQQEINQAEFDHLMRCYLLSRQVDCPYFVANSLEALAEHLSIEEYREQLMADNQPAMKYLNPEGLADEQLPLWLADNALTIFTSFGDTYQIAGAYRTLATCSMRREDYDGALVNLEKALSDTLIYQAPDLVASIREQLCVAYSAIDDKASSDYNRNAYLDLQERTRQDQWLEARASQLEHSLNQLNLLLIAVVIAMVIFIVVILLFYYYRKKTLNSQHDEALDEREEELTEQLELTNLHIVQGKRLYVEQLAKVSLVNGITPFIDRMIHEERCLNDKNKEERIDYIRELTDNVNLQNDILTHWIQLRKGELSVHIETFPLQELFDVLTKGSRGFILKGITLDVQPTTLMVKADKVLTLFMLNTLADNARKFTAQGGRVSVYAADADRYVEISVADTGQGMDEEQLARVFDHKVIVDSDKRSAEKGHGFGLINCKGIIEKYRKLSQLFSVCMIAAESEAGKGSRFYFRLPKKMMTLFLALMMFAGSGMAQNKDLQQASAYADSTYYLNIRGDYQRTMDYADSCRQCLNRYYRSVGENDDDTLLAIGDLSITPPEILWLHNNIPVNYQILLDIRNESAVAALALHEWQLYEYNNRIYTQLFKELSADSSLDSYCRTMQQSQTNKQVAIILLVFLFLAIIAVVAWQLMLLHNRRYSILQERRSQLELMADEVTRLKMQEGNLHISNAVLDNTLSTLKHETMYYPSRIQQLLEVDDSASLVEVTEYYRELYGILSQQAMRQLDYSKMHLKALDHEVLGDAIFIDYLFDILRKHSGGNMLSVEWTPVDEHYVKATVLMPALKLSEEQISRLFMPQNETNIPFLICREIVRLHAEVSNRHACGIRAERDENQQIQILITLPRICKTSKSLS